MLAFQEGPTLLRIKGDLRNHYDKITLAEFGVEADSVVYTGQAERLEQIAKLERNAEDTLDSHVKRAHTYAAMDRTEEALRHYRRAMELDSGRGTLDHSFYDFFGLAYMEASHHEAAIDMFEIARAMIPNIESPNIPSLDSRYLLRMANAHCFLSRTSGQVSKHKARAIEILGQVGDKLDEILDPLIKDDIVLSIALVWDALGESHQAVKLYERLVQREPLELRYYVYMANAHERTGNAKGIEKALHLMEENNQLANRAQKDAIAFIKAEYKKVCKTEPAPPEHEGIPVPWLMAKPALN